MTVWVLTREEQNQHGYVDTSIVAVFRSGQRAIERRTREEEVARAEGLLVDGDPLTPAGEWQYSLNISMHVVDT